MFSNSDIYKIKNGTSREYFEEVLKSYYSKSYRASILLLYNLVVDDLYDKIQEMNERKYSNNLSEKMKEIEELKKSEKYSEIEEKIYKIYKENKILNHSTIDTLEYLKKVRNKCAHPGYFKEEKYTPSEEIVYMFIKEIYKDILTQETFIKDPYSILKLEIESEKWGNVIEILGGIRDYEKDFKRFYVYITQKYLEKFTDHNFKKLFTDLMKVIILKKDEWEKINQYRNMMLMRSLLTYLNEKGKMEVLQNSYNWWKIEEEHLVEDENKEIYENEWFALTYLYEILTYNNFFISELREQNETVYNQLKENKEKIKKYWKVFYKDEEEWNG